MFQVYATMDQRMPLSQVAAYARRVESLGYDGLCVPEAAHDGLVAASVAVQATTVLQVATSVLVAFPRSPMSVAHAAWDLQELSGGRFELGLGSQVRGNIEGRYSTAWTPPVPRMREYVQSLRAIFDAWQNGSRLRFEGEHYRFTRMQPFFNPGPLPHPEIPVLLGGIGPGMTALAGEVADALVTHPTNTAPRYLREVVRPRLEKGARRGERTDGGARLMVGPLVAAAPDAAGVAREREWARRLLGFLYSTPAYVPSLELFGWQERGERLGALAREGRWDDMSAIVDDPMLDTLVPSAPYAEIADVLIDWYGELADRTTFPVPADPANDPHARRAIERLQAE
ncbi:MAG: TIGR03617 family F420-dependent LLM class oxidoreductase [Proteobacteria bacterium]|nr:TIGR03617 family F420-dependent LLM class oxidoreductase [Pseudomonadota bacterium]